MVRLGASLEKGLSAATCAISAALRTMTPTALPA
jgi:hypothetical protein